MRVYQVDAFTRTRFTGNPASVVLDAERQADAMLAAIAREFAHAEVAFVFDAAAADHDIHLRFFNARKEAPFVGHATLAAHAVLLALGRRGTGVCRQLSGTGVIDVRVHEPAAGGPAAGDSPLIEFRQVTPELAPPLTQEATLRVAAALRLPVAQLHTTLPARIARRGSARLLLPVAAAQALDGLRPDFDALIALGQELGADGFFAFAVDRSVGDLATDSRMFCPALGIPEDPVSGNAHAMLAAYLWDAGQLDRRATGFVGRQGRHMQRPGEVRVVLETEHDRLLAAHIGGRAVIVSSGTL